MSEFLTIKNWKRFQHYKNRNPPWIKLHYEILTSPDWVMIDDASKLLAIVCMMLASRNEGRVPNDLDYIQRVAHLSKKPCFKQLIKCGFFVDASTVLADASTKTEAEEIRLDKDALFDSFWSLYPKKEGRKKSKEKYLKALDKTSHENIMQGLESYRKCEKVVKGFIMNPETWINGEHWNDEYASTKTFEYELITKITYENAKLLIANPAVDESIKHSSRKIIEKYEAQNG